MVQAVLPSRIGQFVAVEQRATLSSGIHRANVIWVECGRFRPIYLCIYLFIHSFIYYRDRTQSTYHRLRRAQQQAAFRLCGRLCARNKLPTIRWFPAVRTGDLKVVQVTQRLNKCSTFILYPRGQYAICSATPPSRHYTQLVAETIFSSLKFMVGAMMRRISVV